MKSIVLKALGAAAIAACLSGSVYAQSSQPAATPAPAPAAAMKSDAKADAKAARKENRKLSYAVRKAIAKGNGLDVSGLAVRAKNGAVTLSGTMPDAAQIDKAAAAAKSVPGVTSVNNRLTILNSPQ